MKKIKVSDITMKQKRVSTLSFREKLNLVELLDKLNIDTIEISPLSGSKADSLCAKSLAQTIKNSTIAIPVGLSEKEIDSAWEVVSEAKSKRLQVVCPTSSVQMEYLYHIKPDAMQKKIVDAVSYCKKLCENVEFVACDATRSDKNYLFSTIEATISAGANLVTVSDDAGNMMPDEYNGFITEIVSSVDGIKNGDAELAVTSCNQLSLADICLLEGAKAGATELKASVFPEDSASLQNIVKVIRGKGDSLGFSIDLKTIELQQIASRVEQIFNETKNKKSPFESFKNDRDNSVFTANDDLDVIVSEIKRRGYDLSEEDNKLVFDTFLQIAKKKEQISGKELEAIIASYAMQVPPTYKLEDFVITTGNTIGATCHIRLYKKGELLDGVGIGDGPVDASFLAIERIIGHHFELDDFQVQAVSEGRTAMGETIVKLRAEGKLFSGRGISTDVIGSSIQAYINALNKISYEEENS